MQKLKIIAALIGLLAAVGVLQVGAAAPAQAAGSVHGCPRGAFCIYPGTGWNNDRPEYVFTSYGAHNLYNEIGWRTTYNNQYADPAGTYPPTVGYCYGYNGTGGAQFANDYLGAGSFNATPINSIELIRYVGGGASIHVC
jgi:hypothetical protein